MQYCDASYARDCSECMNAYCPYMFDDESDDDKYGSHGEYADDEYESYEYGRD